jgi:putrescine aminotransferase
LGEGLSRDDFGLRQARLLEAKILELGAETDAAFIAEPIQGAGGVIIPPDSYWPEIQRICHKYDILLVADEVITGFGRIGEWFASDYYGIEPDLITFAKGVTSGYLPLGGVLVSDRVADVLIDKGGEFYHGYTYSGHPAACAVAIANLKLLRREKLIERIRDDIGPYLQQRWATLGEHSLVGETRMVGLMGAFEIVRSKDPMERFEQKLGAGPLCRDYLVNSGVVMRAVGDTIICAPPFTLSHEQADQLVEVAWRCLDLAQKDLLA